ncbi:aluminum activated malate transporter-domain-containing protein [Halteromyces radiatus]|uniref:aluminum activated malate transporter-domain-containing protein n=1 Tax=Halteromyces radiatus TaxID=101107 RepID=UPI00221E8AE5|nr:aluminum activated malate transporter-domain-containing protein [Halteromyces radiatus]KAI8084655.1 aluminum activated malate transporter-domain-containing protein [Halteromyces radiatus]
MTDRSSSHISVHKTEPTLFNIHFAEQEKNHRQQHQRVYPSVYMDDSSSSAHLPSEKSKEEKKESWLHRCLAVFDRLIQNNGNRYALQVAIAFSIGSLFVFIEVISNGMMNTVWVPITITLVHDNTVGGFVFLGGQRILGTLIGGGLSMIGMTLARVLFPTWGISANIFLSCYLFVQVLSITKLKERPQIATACGIALVTTAVISLSGYPGLINDKISASVEFASWRILNVIVGIIIAMCSVLCIFPIQASRAMRDNVGESLKATADLFEKAAEYYLEVNISPQSTTAVSPSMFLNKHDHLNTTTLHHQSVANVISRSSSPTRPFSNDEQQQERQLSTADTSDTITQLCDKALGILKKLQNEALRMKTVSSEYYLQLPFHLLLGQRERYRRDRLRAARYADAIDDVKQIVWLVVSYRLLSPLVQLSMTSQQLDLSGVDAFLQSSLNKTVYQRIVPTQSTLESFKDSLHVMRRLGAMLKDRHHKLSDHPDWYRLGQRVHQGQSHIQHELVQLVQLAGDNVDGMKLVSYYGFLVRCAMIWAGLNAVIDKLGPQWHARRSRHSSSSTSLNPFVHPPI